MNASASEGTTGGAAAAAISGKLLFALQWWAGDHAEALRLLELIADLRAGVPCAVCDVWLVARHDAPGLESAAGAACLAKLRAVFGRVEFHRCTTSAAGHPAGPNSMVAEAWQLFLDRRRAGAWDYSGLWLAEPDSVPLRVDWMEAVHAEWGRARAAGHLVLGHQHVRTWGTPPHINGNAVFAPELAEVDGSFPRVPEGRNWDMAHRELLMRHAAISRLIFSDYDLHRRWKGSAAALLGGTQPLPADHPLAGERLRPAWLHAFKGGELAHALLRREFLPRPAVASQGGESRGGDGVGPGPEQFTSVVMAHGAARDTVLRHLRYWQATSQRVIFLTPANAALNLPGLEEVTCGQAEHHGIESNKRTRLALELLRDCGTPFGILHEYDSLCFDVPAAALPVAGGFAGTVYLNEHPDRWKGRTFVHYPHIYTPSAAEILVREMDKLRPDAQQGMSDRYIALAAERAGVIPHDLGTLGLAYTRNTIKPRHHQEAVAATSRGALFFHGIKTAEVLDLITRARPAIPTRPPRKSLPVWPVVLSAPPRNSPHHAESLHLIHSQATNPPLSAS